LRHRPFKVLQASALRQDQSGDLLELFRVQTALTFILLPVGQRSVAFSFSSSAFSSGAC
jgi:hypothetical protein